MQATRCSGTGRGLLSGVLVAFAMIGCRTESAQIRTPFDLDARLGAWVEMWNTYDLDQVDQLFVRDDRLTYFSSEKEGVIRGLEAVREHHRGFGFVAGGKDQPNTLWLEGIQSDDLGETVIVTAIWFFQRPSGPPQRGPVTFVYLRDSAAGDRLVHLNFGNYPDDAAVVPAETAGHL